MIHYIYIIATMLLINKANGQIIVGKQAPLFSLPDSYGNIFDLKEYIGKKNLVIYFYPKDETTGCTAEACTFRDKYEDFLRMDAIIIGISADTPESHKKFSETHQLPFTLLSDKKNEIRKLYGVKTSFFGLIPGRVTYVIDKKGIVRLVFNSQTQIDQHISEALRVLNESK